MSYFAVALVSLLTAECLMATGYGFPAVALAAPQTLVVVHVAAIGWLSLLLCGALFQFVPVLVAKPLYSNFLPLPTLVLLCAGLLALLCGFLQLAGTIELGMSLLPVGGTLLALGFALALWNLGRTLWAARPLGLPARFVVVGLASLVAAAGFGIIFAFVLSGATAETYLTLLTAAGLPLHVIAGLGGWLTISAMGVSYRLLAMFMLAPELEGASTRGALYLSTAAVAVAVVGGVVAICNGADLGIILPIAGLLAFVALVLYGSDLLYLYRARRRRLIELNSRMAGVALANLAASVVLALILAATGLLTRDVGAVVFLIAFGWLSGLGLAQLYKIVAFLTWLECYGPVLGKTRTPRVQDLVTETRASKWFVLYFVAIWAGTVVLLMGPAWAFQATAGIMLIATAGIAAQIVRTRRLADVANAMRLPEGTHRPRLLLSLSPQTSFTGG
ncbi:MAG: hypothetical protein ACRECV_09760 [Xanthobacteraceae bacterium]